MMMPWFGRMFDRAEFGLAFEMAAVFPVAGYVLWRVLSALAESREAWVSDVFGSGPKMG
jgi:hypothetical protein